MIDSNSINLFFLKKGKMKAHFLKKTLRDIFNDTITISNDIMLFIIFIPLSRWWQLLKLRRPLYKSDENNSFIYSGIYFQQDFNINNIPRLC